MRTKSFAVFDSDSHVVEPPVLWEKHLDPEYRTLGKHALWRHEGRSGSYLKVNGEIFRDTGNPNLPRHALWRPGMSWDAIGELDPHMRHPMNEGASDPRARLADMDAMGIDQALLYPTWFAEGFFLVSDPDVAFALARAYNDWITDFCRAAPQRLFAAAILPLQNLDFALDELQRVAAVPTFRAVFVRPMFVENRYLNHTYYEPLWAELERLGITAAVHPTPGLWNPEWTSHGPFFEKVKERLAQPAVPGGGGGPFAGGAAASNTTFFPSTPLGHPLAPILAPWLDNHMFVASTLIGFAVMERYPAMKVVVAHGKASWMQEVLEKMDASTRVIPLLSGQHRARRDVGARQRHARLRCRGTADPEIAAGFCREGRLGLALPAPRCDERLGCAGPVARGQCTRGDDRPHDGAERRRSIRR